MLLRPGRTPSGIEVRAHLRRLVRRLRKHWPATRITIRGDGHYGRPEVMEWATRMASTSLLLPVSVGRAHTATIDVPARFKSPGHEYWWFFPALPQRHDSLKCSGSLYRTYEPYGR